MATSRAKKAVPLRVSISLTGLSNDRLVVRTEKQDDGTFKSVVIHIKGKIRRRGMSVAHKSFEEARRRVEKLVREAEGQGWAASRRSRSRPDQFEILPKPAVAR